jgi:hypothetical protein
MHNRHLSGLSEIVPDFPPLYINRGDAQLTAERLEISPLALSAHFRAVAEALMACDLAQLVQRGFNVKFHF